MVSFGSKALPSKKPRIPNTVEDYLMGEDDKSYKYGRKKKNLSRKAKKESFGFDADSANKTVSGRGYDGIAKSNKSWKHHSASEPQTSVVRYCYLYLN